MPQQADAGVDAFQVSLPFMDQNLVTCQWIIAYLIFPLKSPYYYTYFLNLTSDDCVGVGHPLHGTYNTPYNDFTVSPTFQNSGS